MARLIVLVAFAFLSDAAVFVFVRRAAPQARRAVAHLSASLAALVVVGVAGPAFGVPVFLLVPGCAMAVCNAYALFHLDNMAETARRVRILRELLAAPDGLDRQTIVLRYPPREVFDRRVARLKLAGQVREEDGRLRPTGGVYSLAERLVNATAEVVFGRKRSGL